MFWQRQTCDRRLAKPDSWNIQHPKLYGEIQNKGWMDGWYHFDNQSMRSSHHEQLHLFDDGFHQSKCPGSICESWLVRCRRFLWTSHNVPPVLSLYFVSGIASHAWREIWIAVQRTVSIITNINNADPTKQLCIPSGLPCPMIHCTNNLVRILRTDWRFDVSTRGNSFCSVGACSNKHLSSGSLFQRTKTNRNCSASMVTWTITHGLSSGTTGTNWFHGQLISETEIQVDAKRVSLILLWNHVHFKEIKLTEILHLNILFSNYSQLLAPK